MRAHELLCAPISDARVVAIALNTVGLPTAEAARAAIASVEDETGIPCDDVPRFGADRLLDALLSALASTPEVGVRTS